MVKLKIEVQILESGGIMCLFDEAKKAQEKPETTNPDNFRLNKQPCLHGGQKQSGYNVQQGF